MIITQNESDPWLLSGIAKERHRKLLGPDLYIEDSVPEHLDEMCQICSNKKILKYIITSPKNSYLPVSNARWICGSEECIQMFILANL